MIPGALLIASMSCTLLTVVVTLSDLWEYSKMFKEEYIIFPHSFSSQKAALASYKVAAAAERWLRRWWWCHGVKNNFYTYYVVQKTFIFIQYICVLSCGPFARAFLLCRNDVFSVHILIARPANHWMDMQSTHFQLLLSHTNQLESTAHQQLTVVEKLWFH